MTDSPNIIPINIEDEIRQSYMDYAMSVIIGRALPDVRDGLKPVHRRILYTQHELGNRYNTAYKKSARVVGDVMGKYHPHGDSAIYDALVRMAQGFNMRVPLVDGQGNFGSVDGDPAAAMRYTEVRMARVASEFLGDIDKDTVDWEPNYDDSLQEPQVLPTKIPNLLVNGSAGIAVGMSTNVPPHNLGEIVDATIALIDEPGLSAGELMEIVPGPDFPTGGIIYGAAGIRSAYETGRGVIRIRARVDVEVNQRTSKPSLIVSELPYQVNKAKLLEKIADLVRDKRVEGITDLRDESDRSGMRMVIELRRDVVPEVILNNLFKMTLLQSSFGIINLAIVNGQPKIMALDEILNHFIDFRRDVVTRRTIFELRQAEARAHVLEGLKIALDNLDEVIALIRASANVEAAREGLRANFGLSTIQAQAILDMRLQKLTGLERDKILEELAEVRAEIARLRAILGDETLLMALIREELVEVKERYANERRTEIVFDAGDFDVEDLIAEEDMVVAITHQGYVKRTALDEYRAQKRGGKGKRGMATKDEDFVRDLFVATTHTAVLMFSSVGKVYKRKVHQLPVGSRTTRGRPFVQILPLVEGEKILAVLPIEEFEEGKYVVTATHNGIVKKTELWAYRNVHVNGIIALGLKEDDHLVDVKLTEGDDCILLASRDGQSICFHEDDIRSMGRTAAGVIGLKFRGDDYLIGMEVIPGDVRRLTGLGGDGDEPESDSMVEASSGDDDGPMEATEGTPKLLTLTERGYGKRTELNQYRLQGRAGMGVITIKTGERNGHVVGIKLVDDGDQIMLITNQGQLIRTRVSEISVYGRNTQGVRIMNVDTDEALVSFAHISEPDEDEDDLDESSSSDVESEAAEADETAGADESEEADAGDDADAGDGSGDD